VVSKTVRTAVRAAVRTAVGKAVRTGVRTGVRPFPGTARFIQAGMATPLFNPAGKMPGEKAAPTS